MKSFGPMKFSLPFFLLGATLILAPQSRAQAEVAPDHFDGTDSWAATTVAKVVAPKAKPAYRSAALQTKKQHAPATPQLTAAKNLSDPQPRALLLTDDKRKSPTRKP